MGRRGIAGDAVRMKPLPAGKSEMAMSLTDSVTSLIFVIYTPHARKKQKK
jgi:hypothetical protein